MKKILLCSICMIFTLLVFTGCKNKKEEKIEDVKPTGNITYFSFNYGIHALNYFISTVVLQFDYTVYSDIHSS